ncbi:MAG: hypothetical protein R3E96_14235 [Planctomycetota bacterium]
MSLPAWARVHGYAAQEAWEEDGLRCLTLVEGLLSTLDQPPLPALDAWFEGLTAIPAEPAPARIPEPRSRTVLDMDAIAAELEREAEDLAAPDFLDRIVEQRLSAIEQEVACRRTPRAAPQGPGCAGAPGC